MKLPSDAYKPIIIPPNSYKRQEFLFDAGDKELSRYLVFNVRSSTCTERQQLMVKVQSKGFERGFSFSDNVLIVDLFLKTYLYLFTFCGCGEIGRHARLRI